MSWQSTNAVWYVYGIVPADLPPSSLPPGLEGAGVFAEPSDGVAALVSVLDDAAYQPASIDRQSGDMEWLSPRAVAHDRVLTSASDHGAVIPLPMFSLFSGRDAVHTMLRDRSTRLTTTLRRLGVAREYALRVHRVDAELLAALPSLSPRLAELAGSAAAASPGQRYLLERKLEGEKKAEVRSVSQRIVEDIATALAAHAVEHERSPVPRLSDTDAHSAAMVLNVAFLIAPGALSAFQRTLTALVEQHGTQGFRFDFTGPWPPYHFVADRAE